MILHTRLRSVCLVLMAALEGCSSYERVVVRKLTNFDIIEDGCNLGDVTKNYFASGRINNVPKTRPSNFNELIWGDLGADSQTEYHDGPTMESSLSHILDNRSFSPEDMCRSVFDVHLINTFPNENIANPNSKPRKNRWVLDKRRGQGLCVTRWRFEQDKVTLSYFITSCKGEDGDILIRTSE